MSRRLRTEDRNKSRIPLIAHTKPREVISEQLRQIRTNILFSAVDKEIKSIMITSPEPSDGKSTVSSNLSIVLSQQEKRVLLVDTDLRKPTVHYSFSASNIVGLTSILTKEVDLEGAISKTYIPNLDILTSGPIPPNPSELLNSKAMETLMKNLNERYEYIVYDTPPLLAVTDPQIIANRCDGVVMVVASRKTSKDRALKAKELLEKAKARIIGVIVNRVESKKGEYFSSYS